MEEIAWDKYKPIMEVSPWKMKMTEPGVPYPKQKQEASGDGNASAKTGLSLSPFSYATSDDKFDEIIIPLPETSICSWRSSEANQLLASDTTPLVTPKRRRKTASDTARVLFGYRNSESDFDFGESLESAHENQTSPRPRGISGFFFGFMYEEHIPSGSRVNPWESAEGMSAMLKLVLCASFLMTTAASTVPVTLVPVMAQSLLAQNTSLVGMSAFTSRAAASAVIGSAIGKFINGPLVDVLGARRVSIVYATFLAIALVVLSMCNNESSSLWAFFFVEFFQSVQWPGIIVILASHTHEHQLETGIYAASLSSRLGSLLSIPLTSLLLRSYQWRTVAVLASLVALLGASLLVFVTDSPKKVNDPQNPISSFTSQEFISRINEKPPVHKLLLITFKTVAAMIADNLVPAIKSVLKSITFWIVAIAHAGDAIIYTSTRVLGMYYYDTSGGALSENTASSLAVVLSLGTILGLAIAGNIFTATSNPRGRKRLIGKLYLTSICACYLLAILAIPTVQQLIGEAGLTLTFQLFSTFFMGFGGAVPSYIPGIVGADFGKNKGVFLAYSDGIAFGLSSLVWKVVGEAIHGGGSGGWAYGWAAVALLVVICALVMLEFFENYFVRRCQDSRKEHAGYETIIFV